MTLKLLDTFAGIGGFSYAAEKLVGGFKTVQFIENDPYCQQILSKNFPKIPIHDDITTYRAEPYSADIITGGFPCTDISVAGRGEGITEATRSGLWFQLIRTIRMVRPKYFILENVSAILTNGMDIVLRDIFETGLYECQWCCIPSSAVGACHQRDRWWLVGYIADTDNYGRQRREYETRNENVTGKDSQGEWSANTKNSQRQSDDGDDITKSRIDADLSGSSDGGKTTTSNTGRICELSEGSDNNQETSRENNNQENNDRTLVSQGQQGVQLSINRELDGDKTTFEVNKIRQGNDYSSEQRMDNKRSVITNSDSDNLQARSQQLQQQKQTIISSINSANTKSSKRDGDETQQRNGKPRTQKISRDRDSSRLTQVWKFTEHRLNPNWREYISKCVIRRGDDGLSTKLDAKQRIQRLKMLGNSIVPAVATIPLQRVLELEREQQ